MTMPTSYEKTPNLALNKYGDNDPADLRDGYNDSIDKIDTAVHENTTAISNKADKATTYTKTEVDASQTAQDKTISNKADKATTYTKTEVDASQKAQDTTIGLVKNRVTSIENSIAPKTHYLVAFGDSVSVGRQSGISSRYTKTVAEKLGLTEKNFAVNGAAFGFARMDEANTIPVISSQVDTASNDTSFDHNLVDYVIIGGGVNDVSSPQFTDSQSGLESAISKCVTAFPSAKIILNLGQGGFIPAHNGWSQYKSKLYEGLLKTAKFLPVTIVPAYKILFPFQWDSGIMESDGIHPAQSGHDLMANSIVGAIEGGHDVQWCPTEWFQNSPTSNSNLFPPDSIWNNDATGGGHFVENSLSGEIDLSSDMIAHIRFHVAVKQTSDNAHLTNVLRLPNWAIWRGGTFPSRLITVKTDVPIYINAPFTIDTNGGQWVGIDIPGGLSPNPIDFYLDVSWRVI